MRRRRVVFLTQWLCVAPWPPTCQNSSKLSLSSGLASDKLQQSRTALLDGIEAVPDDAAQTAQTAQTEATVRATVRAMVSDDENRVSTRV